MVVCSVLTVGLAAYQNDWGDSLYVMCNTRQGEALYRVQSVHSNSKGDHRWMWQCKRIVLGAMFKYRWSAWSEYGKQVDSDYQCKEAGVEGYKVLSGVRSVHSNQVEDRKWSFYCCTSTAAHLPLSVLKAWVGLGQPGSARATYYCYARRI